MGILRYLPIGSGIFRKGFSESQVILSSGRCNSRDAVKSFLKVAAIKRQAGS